MASKEVASSSIGCLIGSSFPYSPLPGGDYYSGDAANEDTLGGYPNALESESEAEEPETQPLDYMGTGTPLFTPQLMAKVLQAKAAGHPLQIGHTASPVHAVNGKKPEMDKRMKRGRKMKGDADPNTNSIPTAQEPPPKRPKGWKGWALVEVSSSEDKKVTAALYDKEGRRIKSCSTKWQSQTVEEASESDSEDERVKSKPGWKGRALVQDPPDRSKLIQLDAPPLVFTTRATRSGRGFG
ncbi:hypothetical protein M407DRAFT_29839 [Tulasnella calospora MUT 4182]|uniref:Uncharacterized protein n=1 Tax=Tulasnella calospora MUT 4182 TaxID=1051891 RepID=A0A0C3LGD6_9AGAM|nr:hypothetical protein M407DRAFT_29839 [Tulasnella calospora MUT 4182]